MNYDSYESYDKTKKDRPYKSWTDLLSDNGMPDAEIRKLLVKGGIPEYVTIKNYRYKVNFTRFGKEEGYMLIQLNKVKTDKKKSKQKPKNPSIDDFVQ